MAKSSVRAGEALQCGEDAARAVTPCKMGDGGAGRCGSVWGGEDLHHYKDLSLSTKWPVELPYGCADIISG